MSRIFINNNNIFNTLKINNFKFEILVFQKHISKSKPESGKSKKKIAYL